METGIAHIDSLLEKRSSFHFTCKNTSELKDALESLLPISNNDLLNIKGFEVPQTHTLKSIQGFIIIVGLTYEDKAEAFYKNDCNATIDLLSLE